MTSPTTTLTEAEQRQCERIWKRYWNRPDKSEQGIESTVRSYLFKWALLHWDELQPHVDREVLYATNEDIPMTMRYWEKRIATKVERRVRK
jgi:hypothetical protein